MNNLLQNVSIKQGDSDIFCEVTFHKMLSNTINNAMREALDSCDHDHSRGISLDSFINMAIGRWVESPEWHRIKTNRKKTDAENRRYGRQMWTAIEMAFDNFDPNKAIGGIYWDEDLDEVRYYHLVQNEAAQQIMIVSPDQLQQWIIEAKQEFEEEQGEFSGPHEKLAEHVFEAFDEFKYRIIDGNDDDDEDEEIDLVEAMHHVNEIFGREEGVNSIAMSPGDEIRVEFEDINFENIQNAIDHLRMHLEDSPFRITFPEGHQIVISE